MRGTALALGITGGIIGLITSFLVFVFGALGAALNAEGAHAVVGLSWLAFVAAVVGIVGGALALRYKRIAAGMMLGACIAGFIATSIAWIVAGIFLFVGALLAFLAWFTARNRGVQPPHTGHVPTA
jgi:thiosulfate reductase cytochrome b subunit